MTDQPRPQQHNPYVMGAVLTGLAISLTLLFMLDRGLGFLYSWRGLLVLFVATYCIAGPSEFVVWLLPRTCNRIEQASKRPMLVFFVLGIASCLAACPLGLACVLLADKLDSGPTKSPHQWGWIGIFGGYLAGYFLVVIGYALCCPKPKQDESPDAPE